MTKVKNNNQKLIVTTEIKNKFLEKTENIPKDKRVALIVHDGPDPDAFGHALALQEHFSLKGVEADIIGHSSSESNLQNQAIKKALEIEIKDKKFFEKNKTLYALSILCDTNNSHTSISVEPDIIIDHHKMPEIPQENCLLVCGEIGASCTIVYKLLEDLKTELSQESLTALAIGIYTDTKGLTEDGTTDLDGKAYMKLVSQMDWEHYMLFDRLCHRAPISQNELDLRGLAYTVKKKGGELAYVFLGQTTSEHKNLYGPIADDFLRLADIEVVVILAVEDGKFLKGSIRVASETVQVKELIEKVFHPDYYTDESGASAGSRTNSGGFVIPLSHVEKEIFKSEESEEEEKEKYLRRINKTYFNYLVKFLSGGREGD